MKARKPLTTADKSNSPQNKNCNIHERYNAKMTEPLLAGKYVLDGFCLLPDGNKQHVATVRWCSAWKALLDVWLAELDGVHTAQWRLQNHLILLPVTHTPESPHTAPCHRYLSQITAIVPMSTNHCLWTIWRPLWTGHQSLLEYSEFRCFRSSFPPKTKPKTKTENHFRPKTKVTKTIKK